MAKASPARESAFSTDSPTEASTEASTGRERAAVAAADARLMEQFKRGDAKAFETLLKRYRKPMYNFCLRMLGNDSAAEDAAQEVFLKVVRSAARWQQQAMVSTWMFTIARNHCIDAIRKAAYRKTASLDQTLKEDTDAGLTLGDRVSDDKSLEPDRGAQSIRLREILAEAIGALSEEQREVFVMREYAGMPFKEIAKVVGVSENTVKSRMRYALEHLRDGLGRRGVSPETT